MNLATHDVKEISISGMGNIASFVDSSKRTGHFVTLYVPQHHFCIKVLVYTPLLILTITLVITVCGLWILIISTPPILLEHQLTCFRFLGVEFFIIPTHRLHMWVEHLGFNSLMYLILLT